ncbi:MAG: nucleoside/nucleotide kinase family protein [Hespellia sp.]|nr:nucleoside/nucleotide kinase family protein [Hespellia sp.]
MKEWEEYRFVINGLDVQCKYTKRVIEEIFKPLLRHLTELQKKKGERIIVFLSAAPAVGKSTLVSFLEYLSDYISDAGNIQALGMDGFHYHSDYIKTHDALIDGKLVPMQMVKGCPETFDLDKLKEMIVKMKQKNITWPVYDRKIHDVVEDAVKVTGDIILIEGNWLLLNEGNWSSLKELCDYSIRIRGDREVLKKRLIDRKIAGGLAKNEAVKFYQNSDSKNVTRALNNLSSADLELFMEQDGDFLKM